MLGSQVMQTLKTWSNIALQQVTNAVLWVAEEYEHEEAGKPVAAQSSVEPAV